MKRLPVSGGLQAIVSEKDYRHLSQFAWMHNGTGYAVRWLPRNGSKKKKGVLMHVEILGKREGLEIDHINSNGLDNRRENLRFVDHGTNMQRSESVWAKSGYKGVKQKGQKWVARVGQNYLGIFNTALEAAGAYDKAVLAKYGEHAKVNVRDGTAA